MASRFLMVISQPLVRKTKDPLGSPLINFALAKDDTVTPFFERDLAVFDPLLNIRAGQVQIIGDLIQVEQFE
jgi:hypothetical protein